MVDVKKLMADGLIKKGNDESLYLKRIQLGLPQLDDLLGGGVPVGRCLLAYGPESTGKTLLAQYITAAVQKTEKPLTLLMDLERCFDKAWWEQSGVDTDQLMVSSPATAEEAIDIMMAVMNEPTLGLMIVDSIPAMIPAPIADPEKSAEDKTIGLLAKLVTLMYSKLVHSLSEKGVILLTTNQMRETIGGYDELNALPGGRAQRHFSQIILRTKREGWIKDNNKNYIGFDMEITSKKNKTCSVADGTSITMPFLAAGGIDLMTAYINDGIKKGFITRKGPYYSYADHNSLGIPNLREFFAENPNELETLKVQLLVT